METAVVAIVAALLSGAFGSWLGARIASTHERVEQLRGRRIDAASALIDEWANTLFAIDAAITEASQPTGAKLLADAKTHCTTAVKLSVRVDLLFGITSLPSSITNVMRDETRASIYAIEQGKLNEARQHHAEASLVQNYLVIACGAAIEFTGMSRLSRRRHPDRKALAELAAVFNPPEIDVGRVKRARQRANRDLPPPTRPPG